MIDIREKKLKELFLLLKKEKHIKNTTQAVEFLSILILIKYIDLRFSKQKYNLEFDWDYKGYFFDYCQNVLLSSVNYNFFIEKKEHNKYMLNTLENIIFNLSNDKILYLSYEFLNSINNRYDLCELKEEFDFLIDEMILDTSQSGMYFTPRVLSKVMVSYLNPKADDRIYDPACGTGGFLVESAEHIKDNVKFHLCGNDISFFPLLISNVRLILIGEDDVILQQKNSINNDNVNNKYCYNLIMSHPPFGKVNKSSE